jgi:hypothetical protein
LASFGVFGAVSRMLPKSLLGPQRLVSCIGAGNGWRRQRGSPGLDMLLILVTRVALCSGGTSRNPYLQSGMQPHFHLCHRVSLSQAAEPH